MEITLQYFDGCPNWEVLDRRLAELLDGRSDIRVTRQLVETAEDAVAEALCSCQRVATECFQCILRSRSIAASPEDLAEPGRASCVWELVLWRWSALGCVLEEGELGSEIGAVEGCCG